MTDYFPPSDDLPGEARPRDFHARVTRRGNARPAGRGRVTRLRGGRRLAVLGAAIAVPAMAAPGHWGETAIEREAALAAPMAFETPGESFPGSAFYYLDDQPYLPAAEATRFEAGNGTPAALAIPAPAASPLAGPAAAALYVGGTGMDRMRAEKCLTMAIYYEAASESDAGQRAVAQVVLNRVAHPTYPTSVCGVVFQGSDRTTGCQFSFTCDGSLARKPARMWWDRAAQVARAALAGSVYAPVGLATHYHTVQIHPYWADSLDHVGTIGAHRFYRWRGAAGRPAAFRFAYLGGEPAAAPHARGAGTAADAAADPLALARSFEALAGSVPASAASAHAGKANLAPAASPAPVYSAAIAARGGDALFRAEAPAATGRVREEYANAGAWRSER